MNTSVHIAGSVGLLSLAAFAACGDPLYSNAGLSPESPALNAVSASLSGVPAPGGTSFSEAQSIGAAEANMIGGLSGQSMEVAGAYRFADNFVVPVPGWRIDSMSFFAYQPGAMGPGSPFAAVNVRIWNAAPGTAGASIVFGDTLTNRLTGTSSTNIYRIFNSIVPPFAPAPSTSRLIWKLDAAINTFVPPGTYWVDFQIEPQDVGQQAYVPPATRAGVRSVAGFNALQYRSSTQNRSGAWELIVDAGKPAAAPDQPQDLPFLIAGHAGCAADFNGDMSVDFFDYLDFVDAFSAGDMSADFNHDSAVDFFDYLDFVDQLSAGC